jgi:L-alanine-DL-glutamate epimerase-like enolase superfamily enzyme
LKAIQDRDGFRAFKIRVGKPFGHDVDEWPGRTESILKTVRTGLGDETLLYADANSGFTPARAIEVGRIMEDYGYCHFEEPCPYPELEWTKEVADALDVPVAGGEQDTSMAQWRRMIGMRAVDIVQPDICYVGGFSRALKVAAVANDAGIPCTPHAANRSMLSVFTLHLLAAVGNPGAYMEHSIESTPWTEGLFDPALLAVRDGQVSIPEDPGWGIAVSPDWLASAQYQESVL